MPFGRDQIHLRTNTSGAVQPRLAKVNGNAFHNEVIAPDLRQTSVRTSVTRDLGIGLDRNPDAKK